MLRRTYKGEHKEDFKEFLSLLKSGRLQCIYKYSSRSDIAKIKFIANVKTKNTNAWYNRNFNDMIKNGLDIKTDEDYFIPLGGGGYDKTSNALYKILKGIMYRGAITKKAMNKYYDYAGSINKIYCKRY